MKKFKAAYGTGAVVKAAILGTPTQSRAVFRFARESFTLISAHSGEIQSDKRQQVDVLHKNGPQKLLLKPRGFPKKGSSRVCF